MGTSANLARTRANRRDEVKHCGRILVNRCYDTPMLVDRMLNMGTPMTRTDIEAVLTLLVSAVATVCREGNKGNLQDFIHLTPVMRGTFEGKGDSFTPGRNEVYLTAQVSRAFNTDFSRNATVEKVLIDESRPLLVELVDTASATDALVMGHILGIKGKRLKFTTGTAGEYLRLVNANDPTEFAAVADFYKLTDQEAVFLMPKVAFTNGYFEQCAGLGKATLRKGISSTYLLEASE